MNKNLTIGTKFIIDNVSYKIKDIQERHNIVFAEPIGVKYKKNEKDFLTCSGQVCYC
jgi:hypothetical protein